MDDDLLNVREAAQRLGLRPTTLSDWLSQSDYGLFEIRGQRVTVDYLQGGPRGQGHIRIEAGEVERIRELMRVKLMVAPVRRPPIPRTSFPGITVKLGRPDGHS